MLYRRLLVTSLALLLLAAACSGDDGSENLVLYFEQVEQIEVDFDVRNEGGPETRDIESARAFFAILNAATETALAELSSLVPPESAREPHDQLVDLRGQYLSLNQRIAERLNAIETVEEFNALASDTELGVLPQNALSDRVQAACRELQAVADGEGLEVSLSC